MSELSTHLRLEDLDEDTELTAHQLHNLDLSKLPLKIRLRIRRDTGIAEFQRVGKKLHLRLFADVAFSAAHAYPLGQALYEVSTVVLDQAAWLLDYERMNDRRFRSSSDPIAIAVAPKTTGAFALAELDLAVAALTKANTLLRAVGSGMHLVFPENADLD